MSTIKNIARKKIVVINKTMKKSQIKFKPNGAVDFTVNTDNSTFLQNLVTGKKLFVQLYTFSNFGRYAKELTNFLNSRNIKVLGVSQADLKVTTSHGTIHFCTVFNREKFLKGRNDFIEVFDWEDEPTTPISSSNQPPLA